MNEPVPRCLRCSIEDAPHVGLRVIYMTMSEDHGWFCSPCTGDILREYLRMRLRVDKDRRLSGRKEKEEEKCR